ncbi:hypothetical protein R70006_06304 [Paraburkholderia domus]|uniref:hypothetical protein n=1 Tax=Paraburkholderia domus TaxID=2793075 RepID=UPI0019149E3B|nr:hypothetical protein [Paraburkholderia domus]MBK5052932.1 hypothetical protein [Burkholderia sp. R-70006]CAE6823166.1 hypothetical protein R70006_06304 [Paraburkholderia domus]
MKITFWHDGDRSVGLAGDQAEVALDMEGLDPADEAAMVADAKRLLGAAFHELWDTGAVHAMTEVEIEQADRISAG